MSVPRLRLIDAHWLDLELTAGRELERAWTDGEVLLDPCGRFDRVFGGIPPGAVRAEQVWARTLAEPVFLLQPEHIVAIRETLQSHRETLQSHRETLRLTRESDLATLDDWAEKSRWPSEHLVAYLAGDGSDEADGDEATDGVDDEASRLYVRRSRVAAIAAGLLVLLVLPLAGALAWDAVTSGRGTGLVIAVANALIVGVVIWLVRRGRTRSVHYFDAGGLVLTDGTRFAWRDLTHVVYQIHVNLRLARRGLWRVELHFAPSSVAWVIPANVRNYAEVDAYIRALPCEHRVVTV